MIETRVFECGCGRVIVYECHRGGRPRKWCDDCRREANRASARRSYRKQPVTVRAAARTRWRDGNRERYRQHAREWAKRNRDNVTANTLAYRARKRGAFRHHVDRAVLYEMDRGICGICGDPVARTENWHVDHIVPLSKGGEHSYLNCQVAHARCNQEKNARLA